MSKEKKISSRAKILATIKSSLLTPTPMPFPDLDYATEPFVSNIDSLALQFAKAGHQVLAISRKTPQTLIENPNITCLSIDISNPNELL